MLDLGLRTDRAARRPRRSRLNYQALAGAIAPRRSDDEDPAVPRLPIADLAAGTVAALLVCAAWAKRLQTGEGERIDVAMADVVASWVGPYSGTEMRGRDEPAVGSPGYGVFRCADGAFVTVAVISEDHFWRGACAALELTALRDLDYASRLDRITECNAALGGALARIDRDDAVERLAAAGVPVAPVLQPEESAQHEQFLTRGVFVPDPDGAPRAGFPARLTNHPIRRAGNARET